MNNRKYLCEYLLYSNKAWYQDASLHRLSVYQISKYSDYPFPLYGNFNTFTKRRNKQKEKKNKETKPIFGISYLGNAWCDLVEI